MLSVQLRLGIFTACGLLFVNLGMRTVSGDSETASMVTIETGDLPIIISAPHGGREAIPGVAERQGNEVARFSSKADFNTDRLAEHLADTIEKQLGKRPYVVIARFHRKYLDANRRDRDAFESQKAKAVYDAYHQALVKARSDVIERWGRGVLFDLHGQGAEPKAIFRGTQNGKTTTHLINRFGREALTGENSVFGQLARQDVPVIPATGSSDREHANYDGGYTVKTYGSGSVGTLDAIQLELGRELRSTEAIPATAAKLTNAIAAFAVEYLPRVERTAQASLTKHRTGRVSVGVYCDVGTGPSSQNLLKALQKFEDVSVRKIMADDIRAGRLADVGVLIHPGGSGGGQGRHLREDGREMIRSFIRDGGGFIGICAGAYLASADYPWSLNVLDARVLDRKHWARGKGIVQITLTDTGREMLKSEKPQLEIYYAQGPLLAPRDHPDIDDYEIIATFRTEIAKNGAPMGVMKGTTAIARGQYGRGRVVCFSPHPELTEGLEVLVRYAIDHVRRNDQTAEKRPDGNP